MTRAKYIFFTILLIVAYGVGLPLFIIGITGDDKILFTIIGLVSCGLPTAIITFALARGLLGRGYSNGRKLAAFFIGLILGLVITPMLLIYCLVKAIKSGKKAPQEGAPEGQRVQEEQNPAQDL